MLGTDERAIALGGRRMFAHPLYTTGSDPVALPPKRPGMAAKAGFQTIGILWFNFSNTRN